MWPCRYVAITTKIYVAAVAAAAAAAATAVAATATAVVVVMAVPYCKVKLVIVQFHQEGLIVISNLRDPLVVFTRTNN